MERFFTSTIGVILAATTATFLWGSAFPFVKLGYELLEIGSGETTEQLLFAGYRFLLASVLIIGLHLFINRGLRYQKGTLSDLVKIGLFQTFLQYIFFYIGLSLSTGIQGSIIAGTTSFFQIILAHFMYKNDLLSYRKIIGLLLGFFGVILVNIQRGTFQLVLGIGEILLLFAMFSGALGNILAKNGAAKMNILYMTAMQMLLGSIGLIVVGGFQAGFLPFEFDLKAILVLAYLSFLSAAGFLLWNSVMKYNKVGSVSTYLFFIPVFGVFLSAVILKEELHPTLLLALGLVVSGIVIVNRNKEQKEIKPEPAKTR